MTKEEIIELARKIIENNKYAMIGTNSVKGYPNVRALTKMKHDGFELFYFSTRANSEKVKQMRKKNKGCVYFYNTDRYQSVMLEGTFFIEKNRDFDVSEIYKIDYDDPYDFCTIKFVTENIYVYTHFQTIKFNIKELR
ncbi:MAG: pyridoxamine 5'-phosphate oxidase family protein [Bacilli bacterium]|nr:pyridoxamine 5'-phosphate oxidase family protein [Bacilli bacterium]MDD4282628.1 pyridoxamine 5'-phosphate oxidase family protein [Bacilli bacterium]MDD4718659.1 pyridoxamine 5'-phosphate oxidase family protein [Bacilli bacterium]